MFVQSVYDSILSTASRADELSIGLVIINNWGKRLIDNSKTVGWRVFWEHRRVAILAWLDGGRDFVEDVFIYHKGWVGRSLPGRPRPWCRKGVPHEQRHGLGNSKAHMGTKAVSCCGRITCKAEGGRIKAGARWLDHVWCGKHCGLYLLGQQSILKYLKVKLGRSFWLIACRGEAEGEMSKMWFPGGLPS